MTSRADHLAPGIRFLRDALLAGDHGGVDASTDVLGDVPLEPPRSTRNGSGRTAAPAVEELLSPRHERLVPRKHMLPYGHQREAGTI